MPRGVYSGDSTEKCVLYGKQRWLLFKMPDCWVLKVCAWLECVIRPLEKPFSVQLLFLFIVSTVVK